MNLSQVFSSSFYDDNWDDAPSAIDEAVDRNQRIADRKAELIAEALQGKGDFPGDAGQLLAWQKRVAEIAEDHTIGP